VRKLIFFLTEYAARRSFIERYSQDAGEMLVIDPSWNTASTEMLTAKRHAGVHTPVIACKMIIANQQMAYAA